MNIGVIAYRRSWMGVTVLKDWLQSDRPLVNDLEKLSQVIAEKTAENTFAWDLSKEDFGKNGKRCIEEAIAKITSTTDNIDKLIITGFGPFESLENSESNDKYGRPTQAADLPFRGVPIVALARSVFNDAHISVVTDVTAQATYHYWSTASKGSLRYDSNAPHVVTAFMVGTGIGGASVQRYGEIIGKHSHTEMGHLPGSPHPNDPLFLDPRYSAGSFCNDHREYHCVTNLAGLKALGARACAYPGQDLRSLIDQTEHPIWNFQAYYMAQLCVAAIVTVAPTSVVFGGSILDHAPDRDRLIEKIDCWRRKLLSNYVSYHAINKELNKDDSAPFICYQTGNEGMLEGALLVGLQKELMAGSVLVAVGSTEEMNDA